MFDPQTFIDGIEQAAKDAVEGGLQQVAERARHKAPVRNVYADKTSRKRTLQSYARHSVPTILNTTRGPAYERASHIGREIQKILGIESLGPASRGRAAAYELASRRITGRTNSFAPVVMSPAGRIGGEALRQLSARGVLKVQEIGHAGGKFTAFDLLSSRGRYELTKGRAEHQNPETGELTLGGTLRDSIRPEGPYIGRGEVYGFVRAAAFNDSGFNYAYAQEVGTAHNRPQPYLRPALRELHDRIVNDQRNAFSAALRNARGGRKEDKGFRRTLKLRMEFVGFNRIGEM